MPIRRKLEESVPILLRLVDEVERSKTQDSAARDSNYERDLAQLREIKDFFDKKRTDLFHDLKRTEDELLENFTSLEEKIDDSKYDVDGSRDSPAHPPRAVSIARKFESIKDTVSGLEGLTFKTSGEERKHSESEALAREISEQWSALKVEHYILESSALSSFRWNYDDIIDHKMLIDGKEHTISARNIKLCLLCFSVFPAKSVIKKRPLIYWWLGEGFISRKEEGERIFWELIRKGFLNAEHKQHDTGQDKNPIVDRCTMHPWNLRMLISIAKSAEFFDFDDDTGLPADHGARSRRRCLVKQRNRHEQIPRNGESSKHDHRTEQQQQQQQQNNSSTMVTLFNVNEQYINIDLKWFSEQSRLAVLQLGRWQDSAKHHIEVENEEFLKALSSKKHLKYLSLRGISRITQIPFSFRKLVNLEILDLRACHNLEKLPSDVSYLKKLKHLDLSECHLLESMPKGLEKLTSLQVLKGFVVTTSKLSPCKLENIADNLKQLRKLSIYIRNEAAHMEDLSKLNKFSSLRSLSITWGGGAQDSTKPSRMPSRKTSRMPSRLLSGTLSRKLLSLPPLLKKLDLWCIPEEHPDWLDPGKLQSLTKLYIRGGKLVGFKDNRNRKWSVQVLRLKYLHYFKEEEKELRQRFPYLVYLEIENKAKDKHGASSSRFRSTD